MPDSEGIQPSGGPAAASRLRYDLGVRRLLPEWRALLSPAGLRDDTLAGITVGFVAIPLSLAIALASDVEPGVGLISAIVAGVVCALFNGTPLAVSGPAAAMAVLIGQVVDRYQLSGLLIVGAGCGVLQLLTGVVGLGRLIRFVPVPVIAGFTAGIGAIIFIGQLPRALGLTPPDESHVFDVIAHLGQYIGHLQPASLGLAVAAVVISLGMPRLSRRVPGPLVAVVVPTAIALVLGLDVPVVGSIPRTLPAPRLPAIPGAELGALLTATFMVYALASLETLLSSSAVDKLARGPRHDPDQELIGQGLGNVAVALFGGIPVTGVIARSALNVQAGAKGRRAAIIHSITVMAIVFVLAPVISRIPLAALAGVLLSVALRMMSLSELVLLWRVARSDAFVYVVTFVVIVATDLIAGVQVGLALALVIAAVRLGQTRVRLDRPESDVARLYLNGPVTFLSPRALDPLREAISEGAAPAAMAIFLGEVTSMDTSGAEMLIDVVRQIEARGTRVALVGLPPRFERVLLGTDVEGVLSRRLARGEADVEAMLVPGGDGRPIERLARGVERFQSDLSGRYQRLFESLAKSQQPHTLFITCADSRIVVSLLTSTDPGELFIARNVGNIVPPFGADALPAEGAAVEFAVGILGVREVVVCGHSGCGAMHALVSDAPLDLPSLRSWLEMARPAVHARGDGGVDAVARANVLLQLEHLMTYPLVRERVDAGHLNLHGWFYDIGTRALLSYDSAAERFVPLRASHAVGAVPPTPPAPRS